MLSIGHIFNTFSSKEGLVKSPKHVFLRKTQYSRLTFVQQRVSYRSRRDLLICIGFRSIYRHLDLKGGQNRVHTAISVLLTT